MTDILICIAIVAGIALVCAVLLVLAAKFFGVEEDEKFKEIRECLPGANCGACGFAGCDEYAKALSSGKDIKTNLCVPGADAVAAKVSALLGVEAEDVVEQVATVHCSGDCFHTAKRMEYVGINSCEAAKTLYGGNGKCNYGCIGLGDCVKVCPQGAICIQNGIAHVDTRKCIGCGLCAKACPRGLITVMADVEMVVMTCNNREKGAVARKKCTNACIGCKKCEKNCPSGAITVTDNLAHIDYSKCVGCDTCAKNCPVGCLVISDYRGMHRFVPPEKIAKTAEK